MDTTLVWIVVSSIIVCLCSIVGIFALMLKSKILDKLLLGLVGFSAGALMGGAFLHLLPEALSQSEALDVGLYILIGFSVFFFVERLLHWHHCHKGKCDVHTFAHMNLFGDAVHNFIDGTVIAVSYMADIHLGIVTTVAIIAHEVPQEIGDFAVLIYGGFSKSKALFYNFLSALTAIMGALIGYFLSNSVQGITPIILPFTAGGFIYIAAADLIPELHKEPNTKKSLVSFCLFGMGILLMLGVKSIFEH